MKPSTTKVLHALRKAKSKGITFSDFVRGFEYRKRLNELRNMGYDIVSNFEKMSNGGRRARYVLIKEPK